MRVEHERLSDISPRIGARAADRLSASRWCSGEGAVVAAEQVIIGTGKMGDNAR
jgi:hypothetical protein